MFRDKGLHPRQLQQRRRRTGFFDCGAIRGCFGTGLAVVLHFSTGGVEMGRTRLKVLGTTAAASRRAAAATGFLRGGSEEMAGEERCVPVVQ